MSPRRKYLLMASFLSLSLLNDGIYLLAAEIAVVIEKDIKIYRLALDRFTEISRRETSPRVQITAYFMDGDVKKGQQIIREIQARRPQLIFAIGTNAALIANEEINDIPIVYSMVLNPQTYPLKSKNICGISLDISPREQLAFLRRIKRDVKKVGVIYDPSNSENLIKEAYSFAKASNFELLRKKARTIKEAITGIKELEAEKIDAFLMMFDPIVANETSFKILLTFSLKNRVALAVPADAFVKAGALFSVGADYNKIGDQAWKIAWKILNEEAKPADFGIRYPEEKIIAINDKIARSLGLDIPKTLKIDIIY